MSEKSFAAGSVAVAIVWGTFFYPPPPPHRVPASVKAAPVAAGKEKRLAQAAPRPAGTPERRWWRRNLLQLRTGARHP